jgi:putative DNA modification/repair radical SAM protein
MDVFEKLRILTDAAKYDVACTSSGVDKGPGDRGMGSASACGICHSFSADGRCICLLKVLQSNRCVYDCQYCVNRRSNDTPRAAFEPRELADLTMAFYRRNYIEGLFLSSGVTKNPDYTCEQMIRTLEILRHEYYFNGYIHVKAIPGADSALITRLGLLAERMSVNIELPSQRGLARLAPDKTKEAILKPMGLIRARAEESRHEMIRYKGAQPFAPAGQSTQMIVGATEDTDLQILRLTEGLYKKYALKRVFFSAYMPVVESPLLPSLDTKPPLLREHRLYQADWLLRFYGFTAGELLDEAHPSFNPLVDPKCNWALNHLELFPVEVNRASREMLLRVPGIGVKSAGRIVAARRHTALNFEGLKKLGVVLKRAQFFLTCSGKKAEGLGMTQNHMLAALISGQGISAVTREMLPRRVEQLSLLHGPGELTREDVQKCISGQM